ncbi:unnamed protein product [Musa hybrid cultivar]
MELVDAGASYWCCLWDRLHGFGPFPELQGHTLTTDSFSMRTEIYDNKMLSICRYLEQSCRWDIGATHHISQLTWMIASSVHSLSKCNKDAVASFCVLYCF